MEKISNKEDLINILDISSKNYLRQITFYPNGYNDTNYHFYYYRNSKKPILPNILIKIGNEIYGFYLNNELTYRKLLQFCFDYSIDLIIDTDNLSINKAYTIRK